MGVKLVIIKSVILFIPKIVCKLFTPTFINAYTRINALIIKGASKKTSKNYYNSITFITNTLIKKKIEELKLPV